MSPKRTLQLAPRVKKTPIVTSAQRKALSTQERYGPTPSRPVSSSPSVSVKRHSVSSRRSSTGSIQEQSPMVKPRGQLQKKAKVTVIAETPAATGTQYIYRLPKRLSSDSQVNNSSTNAYYSLSEHSPKYSTGNTNPNLSNCDSYSKSWDPSVTIVSPSENKRVMNGSRTKAFTEPKRGKNPPNTRRNSVPVINLPERSFGDRKASSGIALSEKVKYAVASTPLVNLQYHDSKQSASKSRYLLDSTGVNTPVGPLTDRPSLTRSTAKRGVKFGPKLSPEQFDYRLPPSTPLKRGALPPPTSARVMRASIVKRPRRSSVARMSLSPKQQKYIRTSLSPAKTISPIPDRKSLAHNTVSEIALPEVSGADDLFTSPGRKSKSPKQWTPTVASERKSSTFKRRLLMTTKSIYESDADDVLFASTNATAGSSIRSPTPKRARISATTSTYSGRSSVAASHITDSERQSMDSFSKVPAANKRTKSLVLPKRQETSVKPVPRRSVNVPMSRLTQSKTPTVALSSKKIVVGRKNRSLALPKRENVSMQPRRSLSLVLQSIPPPSQRSSLLKQITTTPVQRRHKTPASREKNSNSLKLAGIRQIVKTPKSPKSPRLSGIHDLMRTPTSAVVFRKSIALPSPKLVEQLKTPTEPASPILGGVRGILTTPKDRPSARLSGVKSLMKSPVELRSPRLSGVRKLLKTPKTAVSPKLLGVRQLLKTPRVRSSPMLNGVRQLMMTPKSQRSPRLSGLRKLVQTPKDVSFVVHNAIVSPEPIPPSVSSGTPVNSPPKGVNAIAVKATRRAVRSPRKKQPAKSKSAVTLEIVEEDISETTKTRRRKELPTPIKASKSPVQAKNFPASRGRRGAINTGTTAPTPSKRGRRAAAIKQSSPLSIPVEKSMSLPSPVKTASVQRRPTSAKRNRRAVVTKTSPVPVALEPFVSSPRSIKRSSRVAFAKPASLRKEAGLTKRGRRGAVDPETVLNSPAPTKRSRRAVAESATPKASTRGRKANSSIVLSTPVIGRNRRRKISPVAGKSLSKKVKLVESEDSSNQVQTVKKSPVKRGGRRPPKQKQPTATQSTPAKTSPRVVKSLTPKKARRAVSAKEAVKKSPLVIKKVSTRGTRGKVAASPAKTATPEKQTLQQKAEPGAVVGTRSLRSRK